jgi:hypothetical protein
LKTIVSRQHVFSSESVIRRFRMGFRFGGGRALAVVQPGSLREQWRVVKACVSADKIVIMQAANTGLNGGSTPDQDDYDRDVVIISTLRIRTLHVIRSSHSCGRSERFSASFRGRRGCGPVPSGPPPPRRRHRRAGCSIATQRDAVVRDGIGGTSKLRNWGRGTAQRSRDSA